MPTLREFVDQVLLENSIQSDPEEIIKNITEIARQRAVNQVAAISDDEIREMVINNADLVNRLAEEKRAKEELRAQRKAEEERIRHEEEVAKKIEEERKVAGGEQLGLF